MPLTVDRMARTAIPALLLTLVLALAFVLPFQGTRHLWGPDEGRYSAVAVEMLDSGNWLLPHRHPDHPHLSKPPLTYWAMATSMAVLGKNTWALRLPSALAFVLTIGCAFTIGKRLQPERPWWPALVVASTAMTSVMQFGYETRQQPAASSLTSPPPNQPRENASAPKAKATSPEAIATAVEARPSLA